ncbi:transposase [Clostridium sp.]|uniref:transposase n=1 Tax=Clostridium sp. TaxID=1506 RepID=UPI002FDEC38C
MRIDFLRSSNRYTKEKNPRYKTRRWIVEITHSWMKRFRKLLVRFEKTDTAYLRPIKLACAFIAFRKIQII